MAAKKNNQERHHEERDINIRVVANFGLALALGTIIVALLLGGLFSFLYHYYRAQEVAPSPLTRRGQLPPEPRLQINPNLDLNQVRAAEEAILNSYHWIDKDAGTVRIPIERAMELILKKPLPAREGTPQPQSQQK